MNGDINGDRLATAPGKGVWAPVVVVMLALGLAALARLTALTTAPLWTDELISWVIATRADAARLVATAADQLWPPVAYLVQRLSLAVGDPITEAALWLRLPNALAGTAAVGALAVIGWRLVGAWPAALAALLLALSQAQILLARDAKGYGLILLLAVLVLGFADGAIGLRRESAVRRHLWLAWSGFVAACVLALYTHTYFALMLACLFTALALVHGSTCGWRPRGALGRLLAAGLLVALAWAPWPLLGWSGEGHPLVQPPDIERVRRSLSFLAGWLPLAQAVLWGGLVSAAVALVLWPRWRRQLQKTGALAIALVLLAVALGPLLLASLLSYALVPLLLEHYLTVSVPAFLLVVSLALGWLARALAALLPGPFNVQGEALGTLALLGLVVFDLAGRYSSDPRHPREDWVAAVAFIVANSPAPATTLTVACTIDLPLIDQPLMAAGWPRGGDYLACHPGTLSAAAQQALARASAVWLVSGHSQADPALDAWLTRAVSSPHMGFRGLGLTVTLYRRSGNEPRR